MMASRARQYSRPRKPTMNLDRLPAHRVKAEKSTASAGKRERLRPAE
jgi:hypothetical protein